MYKNPQFINDRRDKNLFTVLTSLCFTKVVGQWANNRTASVIAGKFSTTNRNRSFSNPNQIPVDKTVEIYREWPRCFASSYRIDASIHRGWRSLVNSRLDESRETTMEICVADNTDRCCSYKLCKCNRSKWLSTQGCLRIRVVRSHTCFGVA